MTWFVYMLRCDEKMLYSGVTTDVERRLREHQAGGAKAARYTRSRRKIELAYAVEAGDKSQALRIEAALKRLPPADKRAVVADQLSLADLLTRLALN